MALNVSNIFLEVHSSESVFFNNVKSNKVCVFKRSVRLYGFGKNYVHNIRLLCSVNLLSSGRDGVLPLKFLTPNSALVT